MNNLKELSDVDYLFEEFNWSDMQDVISDKVLEIIKKGFK